MQTPKQLVRGPRQLLGKVNDYRKRQRELLRESNHPNRHLLRDDDLQPDLPAAGVGASESTDPATDPVTGPKPDATHTAAASASASGEPEAAPLTPGEVRYGLAGRPFDRHSPFYIGFVATLGGVIAWTLLQFLERLSTTITLLIVAFFLALALDPIVRYLTESGTRRSMAVLIVFIGVTIVTGLIILLVVPPVIGEGTALLGQAPDYLGRLLQTKWVQELDQHYEVVEKAQEELAKRIRDGSLVSQVFGGVLGAGRAVVSGVFQFVTVLILTLYFLAALPRMKQAAYAAVPATRRPRIMSLSEEIMRRTGAYAAGQASVATVNAVLSYVMMRILDIPYASVLAVVVGLFGLIPMVGATIGAAVVATVAFFDAPRTALIVIIYYVIYQQIENYVVVPRIMKSTVSVPGAVTIVAALAGGALLGVLGALLAIPVAAGLLLIYEEVLLPRQAQH